VNAVVHPVRRLAGAIALPGDKSVSHRAALLGALAEGLTEVQGFLEGEDCLGTLRAVAALGAEVTRKGPGHFVIQGLGQGGFTEPGDVVDCGNSGTTARLLVGVLAGQQFATVLTGDESLRRRPMDRVMEPLTQMGARVIGRRGGARLPLAIAGARPLRPIHYVSPVASAQVKSAVLLAGLAASGPVSVVEPTRSRDHTERMLTAFGGDVRVDGETVTIVPGGRLVGRLCRVPGDISSAAFFLVAGAAASDGAVTVRGVGVNPTRTGALDVLEAMGARISVLTREGDGEPIADLSVGPGALRGAEVRGAIVPRAIDEMPILAVAAACAEGPTVVGDAAELRVKESDRIRALASELGKMGVAIEERPDGFRVAGRAPGAVAPFHGARVSSWGDHRLAMALVIAGLLADGPTVVEGIDCIATSYPDFVATCRALAGEDAVEVVA
jgi:3-phosphoshikimate 1-carboxyvinyltransferase